MVLWSWFVFLLCFFRVLLLRSVLALYCHSSAAMRWCEVKQMKKGNRVPVLSSVLFCVAFSCCWAPCCVCDLVFCVLEFFLLSCSLFVCVGVIYLGGLGVLSDFRRMRLRVLSDFRRMRWKRQSHALKGKEGLL
jgi:hypothetical protein